MNDFAHRITASLPKSPESWFPNVLFACLEATTQIIKYTISEKEFSGDQQDICFRHLLSRTHDFRAFLCLLVREGDRERVIGHHYFCHFRKLQPGS